jgi:hypothetical protein
MGRYDNIKDSTSANAVALWKIEKDTPFDLTFSDFEEAGTDDAPQLKCVDNNGEEWTFFGAWERNVKAVVKQFGGPVQNWTAVGLQKAKNGKQIELVPINKPVIEEQVTA